MTERHGLLQRKPHLEFLKTGRSSQQGIAPCGNSSLLRGDGVRLTAAKCQLPAQTNVSCLCSSSLDYFECDGDGQASMATSIIPRSLSLGAPSRANVDMPWMTAIVRLANASAAVSFGS